MAQRTFQSKKVPRDVEVGVEWTLNTHDFQTRVHVLFKTKHRQSFPNTNHMVLVPKLNHVILVRQDKSVCISPRGANGKAEQTPKGSLCIWMVTKRRYVSRWDENRFKYEKCATSNLGHNLLHVLE